MQLLEQSLLAIHQHELGALDIQQCETDSHNEFDKRLTSILLMRHVKRRRILVVTPRDPYVGIGGDRLRIHRLARELAKFHDMTLLTLSRSAGPMLSDSPDGVFKTVYRVRSPMWKSWVNALMALPTAEPLQVSFYKSAALQRAVDQLAPQHDIVVSHLIRTAGYLSGCRAVRMLEMTDAISMSMERVAENKPGYFDPRQILYAIEARRLASYERTVASKFDIVSLTSPVDCSYLFDSDTTKLLNNIMVIPNGADIPDREPPRWATRNPGEIAFVGNLHSLQNFDGAWFFAKEVLPLVRNAFPNAYFRVIGPIGKLARRKLLRLDGVRVDGTVSCLAEALSTARIGVCPIRTGAGIKNKVLDYFANGLAVVCSYSAIAGIDAVHDEHVLLADSPLQWSAAITHLLQDDDRAQELGDAGRRLVTNRYRWEQCVEPLVARLDLLLERGTCRPAPDVELAAA